MLVTVELKREDFCSYAYVTSDSEGDAFLKWMNLKSGNLKISTILYRLFGRHEELYKAMRFEYNDDHHPRDTSFCGDCSGFEQFLREQFGVNKLEEIKAEGLKELNAVVVKQMKKLMQKFVEDQKTFRVCTTIVGHSKTKQQSEQELPDVEILPEGYLIVGNHVYSIHLERKDGVSGLYQTLNNSVKEMYESYVKQWKKKIEELERRIKEEKEQTLERALDLVQNAIAKGWQYKDGRFILPRVEVKFIQSGSKIYKAPARFFAENIYITEDNEVFSEHAYHPNVSEKDGYVCIGDLSGANLLTLFERLPKLLETANMNSAFENEATEEITEMLEEELEVVGEVWKNE